MIEIKDPFVGRVLDDKYCVEERLAAGGMGAVYRARHVEMDRPVAINVLQQRFVEDESARTRFLFEGCAAVVFLHRHARSVHDIGISSYGCVILWKMYCI